MRTIGEILAAKAKPGTVKVDAEDSVLEAVRQMDRANTGSVVVLDGDRLVGIFTERDLMRRVVLRSLDIAATPVSAVMTKELVYAQPDEPTEAVMSRMTQHRCRHLPVVDGESLLGVISIGDVMKELADEQTVEIQFLKEYIYSR
jgi:CBS domain-containing protein